MVAIVFSEGPKPPKPVLVQKQLLPHMVDGMAASRPQAVYAEYPTNPESYADGFSKLTYGQFANVVNGLAWWLEDNIGPGQDFETLVYFGPNDFRQNALVLAACKAGYQLLLCSPRNTLAGYEALFSALKVKTCLASVPHVPIVDTLTMEPSVSLRVVPIAGTAELVATRFPHYPYAKRFATASAEPLLVLHTSGTTALPKPVVITHGWVASWAAACSEPAPPGTASLDVFHQGNRMLVMMPPFHGGNLMPTLFDAVHNQTVVIFPLPGAVLAPDHFEPHLMACLRLARPDTALVPAGFIHSIARDAPLLDMCAQTLGHMFYTGGDVADALGQKVADRVRLFNVNGSTELASYAALRPAQHDREWDRSIWKHIMPHPNAGLDFRCHSWDGGDAKFEAVVVRHADAERVQPVFCVPSFADRDEYRTGDLFSPHPALPGLWRYRGRADDCFVLVTGSNINPLAMEAHVCGHPEVRGALMLGQRRPGSALLVELEDEIQADEVVLGRGDPAAQEERRKALIESIWPAVERGNREYYDLARVPKHRIIFTAPDRPMKRTPKGTVRRRPTLDMYQHEIDCLYGSA